MKGLLLEKVRFLWRGRKFSRAVLCRIVQERNQLNDLGDIAKKISRESVEGSLREERDELKSK